MRRSIHSAVLLTAAALVAVPVAAPRYSSAIAAEAAKTPKQAPCAVCSVREGAGDEPVRATATYQGKTYFFCQDSCREEFLKDPGKWIKAAAMPAPPAKPKPGATAVPT